MKDEIKQIIDNLKFISEQESATIEINQNGCKVILDCITNLQEGNHNLLQEIEDMQSKNNKLIEEKEKLKCDLECYENGVYFSSELDKVQSRNEKAIEKLESIRIFGLRSGKTLFSTLINETIDILNGGDK